VLIFLLVTKITPLQSSVRKIANLKKIPLLDRRGAEPDERSESDEVGWWIAYRQGPCYPEWFIGGP
jgi:hypothetical protein